MKNDKKMERKRRGNKTKRMKTGKIKEQRRKKKRKRKNPSVGGSPREPPALEAYYRRFNWRTAGTRRLLPAVYVDTCRDWKPTTDGYPHEPPAVGSFLYSTNRTSEKPES